MSKWLSVKGFTLIELLAVLLILAVLAIITTPVVLNVINDANEKTFLDTSYSINKAANNYYALVATSGKTVPLLITYNNGNVVSKTTEKTESKNYLDYTGTHPYSGNVYISASGEVEMAIYDNQSKICVTKGAEDKTPVKSNKAASNCKLNKTIP